MGSKVSAPLDPHGTVCEQGLAHRLETPPLQVGECWTCVVILWFAGKYACVHSVCRRPMSIGCRGARAGCMSLHSKVPRRGRGAEGLSARSGLYVDAHALQPVDLRRWVEAGGYELDGHYDYHLVDWHAAEAGRRQGAGTEVPEGQPCGAHAGVAAKSVGQQELRRRGHD